MTRIALAIFISITLAGGGAIAACPDTPKKPHDHPAKAQTQADNCINLSAVPQISAGVVAAEPPPAAKPLTYSTPEPAKYEGPTFGFSKPDPGVKPVPTVGYHWSLE
jgi:hypothetical protein